MKNTGKRGSVGVKQIVIFGILLLAGVGLTVMYSKHAKQEKARAAKQAEAARIKRERAEEAARAQRQKEEEARRVEQETREREEKARKEKAKALEEQAKAREKEELERKRKAEEAEAAAAKRRDIYRMAKDRFQAALDFEEHAPSGETIQNAKSGSKFWFVFASHVAGNQIYEVEKTSPANMQITELSPDADAKEVSPSDFKQMMGKDAFAYSAPSGKVWLKCVKTPTGSYPVPKRGQDFCVAAENLGALYETLVGFGTKFDDIKYRVRLHSNSGRTNIQLGEIAFGESLPRSTMEEAIGKQIGRKVNQNAKRKSKVKKPTFKRTVMLYDGSSIKKEITGVTKVPKTFKFPTPDWMKEEMTSNTSLRKVDQKKIDEYEKKKDFANKKWQKLYDEAIRQDKQEEKLNAEYMAALEAEKKEFDKQDEMAAKLSKADNVIDSALEKCKIIVEVVGQK